MLKTTDLELTFLGIVPFLEDKTGVLTPQQIVSLSALLTFKGKSVKQLLRNIHDKGEDINEKVFQILKNSSLRGHASIATTPVLAFTYQASKFLDSLLTGIVFSSSLMASGRRTDTSVEDIIYPSAILKNKKAKKIYTSVQQQNIRIYQKLVEEGLVKDLASRLLPYGIYGTGIICLSAESLLSFKREYQLEREWMPEEAGILLNKIEKNLNKLGIDWLYFSRSLSPRNIYPYPNIFKDPKKNNLVRELKNKHSLAFLTKVLDLQTDIPLSLRKGLEKIKLDKKSWQQKLLAFRQLARDYNLSLNFKVLSSVMWRVWGEKKRHRTVPQIVESVYYCLDKTRKFLKKELAKKRTLNYSLINRFVSLPQAVLKNKKWLEEWLEAIRSSFSAYEQLLLSGIYPRDAIFLIPRGLRIDVLQQFDLFNLLLGYYPTRLCSTAEEEMRRFTIIERLQLVKELKKRKLDFLVDFLAPKCHLTGFCHERDFCPQIKLFDKNYNQKKHNKLHQQLEKELKKNLKSFTSFK